MMTGLEICALIMTTIRDGITSNWFTETFRVGKAFSRTRKLSMSLVMLFLMFKTKASMPNELIHICIINQLLQMESGALQSELLKYYRFSNDTPTKPAFCQIFLRKIC